MVQKSVLITGTSEGGIGDSLAIAFHKKGLRVFATARSLSKVQHLKELGLEVLPLDVTDQASIIQAVESVKALTDGTLDILVNNSGHGYSMPLLDSDTSLAKGMFDVNVFALVEVTQAFAPLLIASRGTVVNIGSMLGHFPFPWQGYYNASKAAVNSLSDQLRLELAPFDVKVINVVTGTVKTKFFQNIPVPPQLPAKSLYSPAKQEVEEFMSGHRALSSAMDVGVYAEAVVKNALKSNPKAVFWKGGETLSIWAAATFGWATIWDYIFAEPFKLRIIKSKIQAAATSKA